MTLSLSDPWKLFSEDEKLRIELVGSLVKDAFQGGDWPLAKQNWVDADLSLEQRAACWSFFNTREQAYLGDKERKYLRDAGLQE